MAAYIVVDNEIIDPEPYEEYRKRVPATLERYGGQFLVRGGAPEMLEGAWHPQRIVVLEFPTIEQARAWYASPEYQEILPIRWRHGRSRMVLVEGA